MSACTHALMNTGCCVKSTNKATKKDALSNELYDPAHNPEEKAAS